jgi:hypothetical protein
MDPAPGFRTRKLAREVGEDHHRELEPLRLVDGHHPHAVAPLLEDRRFGGLRGFSRDAQLFDEPAEGDSARGLVLASELRDVQDVGQRLLAGRAKHQADVRARRLEHLLDRVGHGDVVAPAMKPLQKLQRVDDRL